MSAGRAVWVKIRASEAERGRVAREGALRRVNAVGSGAPVGGPGAHLDRGARRCGARAHPRAGADRGEPEPDRPLGPIPSKRTPRQSRSSPTWSPSSGRSRRWPTSGSPTPMLIKFLARGTGSARAAADYLLGARGRSGSTPRGRGGLSGEPPSGGRGGRCAGVRAQVHLGRDRLGTRRHSDPTRRSKPYSTSSRGRRGRG